MSPTRLFSIACATPSCPSGSAENDGAFGGERRARTAPVTEQRRKLFTDRELRRSEPATKSGCFFPSRVTRTRVRVRAWKPFTRYTGRKKRADFWSRA